VSIIPDEAKGEYGRVVCYAPPKWFFPDLEFGPWPKEIVETMAMCLLAGGIAECIATRGRYDPKLSSGDRENTLDLLERGVVTSQELEAAVDEASRRAEALVWRHWAGVKALAEVLLMHGRLTGRQAEQVLRAALPEGANAEADENRRRLRLTRRRRSYHHGREVLEERIAWVWFKERTGDLTVRALAGKVFRVPQRRLTAGQLRSVTREVRAMGYLKTGRLRQPAR
jgi:hypothetical protein